MRKLLAIAMLFVAMIMPSFAQTLPTISVAPEPTRVQATSPQGVNYATGTFSYNHTDIPIGEQTKMGLERSYTSGPSSVNAEFPFGWSHNFNIRVTDHKLINNFTTSANQLNPYSPYEWPYQFTVILGDRSVPFAGGTGKQNPGPCANPIDTGQAQVCPTGGFIGLYQVGRLGGETLVYTGDESTGHYTFTDKDGTIIYFGSSTDASGALLRALYKIDPDGTRYDFTYSNGILTSVSNNRGYSIVFVPSSSGGYAAQICFVNNSRTLPSATPTCPSGNLTASYSYGATGVYVTGPLMTGYSDTTGYGESYSYIGDDHLACIKRTAASTCMIQNTYGYCQRDTLQSYDPDGLHWKDPVISQTDASGAVYSFNYGANPICYTVNHGVVPTITLPDSSTRTYGFTPVSDSLPSTITDELGRVTSATYGGLGTGIATIIGVADAVSTYTTPGGVVLSYAYDTRGNIKTIQKKSSDGQTVSETYTYPATCDNPTSCNKPTAFVDAKGNETDWTYTSFGAVQRELEPAPTAGAARPLTLSTYVQQYAYVLNSSGALVAAASPVWLPSTETQCQTVAGSSALTCDTGAGALNVVTTYQYGAPGTADTLLLRGKVVTSGGVSLRTCYGYDGAGNQIWETKPDAGLGNCS